MGLAGQISSNCYVLGVIGMLPHYTLVAVVVPTVSYMLADLAATLLLDTPVTESFRCISAALVFCLFVAVFHVHHALRQQKRSRDLGSLLPPVSRRWEDPLGDKLKNMMTTGDDDMDIIVKRCGIAGQIMRNPAGSEAVLQEQLIALQRGDERPSMSAEEREDTKQRIAKVLKEVRTVPEWVDGERIRQAVNFYRDNLVLVLSGLTVALIESYAFPVDAKVLYISGGLTSTTSTTVKRLLQTSSFVLDVVSKEGPFPGTDVHKTVFGVRAIHTVARSRCLRSKYWDMSELESMPISQATQLGTLCLFCHCPIELMKVRGILVTREEEELCWELWRYVGYILGVDEEYLPTSYADGLRLRQGHMYRSRQVPDDTSRKLTENTFAALRATKSLPLNERNIACHLHALLGKELSLGLGITEPTSFEWTVWWLMNNVYRISALLNRESIFLRQWSNYFLHTVVWNVIKFGEAGPSLEYIKPGKPL
mmetsp:Transcript_11087/g.45214  ORF Transcript_11087/g.45214 Transcript_11087/m.45214 type:complete len:481 (-) Transcript_11087:31-1473(-)